MLDVMGVEALVERDEPDVGNLGFFLQRYGMEAQKPDASKNVKLGWACFMSALKESKELKDTYMVLVKKEKEDQKK